VAVDAPSRVELEIGGMTCASCAARVEKKLNKLDGVEANVNYATELASVSYDPEEHPLDELLRTVEAAGYSAALPSDASAAADLVKPLRRRLLVSTALTVPLVLLAMVPPFQLDGWEWVALALATPIVLWAGLPFHRAAVLNARHLTATMDTLISIGTLAAWGWSVVVLLAALAPPFELSSSSARRKRACFATVRKYSSRWRSFASAIASSSSRARRFRPTGWWRKGSPPSTSRC
jgi:P-type Cu+ transporter